MLVLNKAQVEELLDIDDLVDAVADAMADLSAGLSSMPPRIAANVPERHALLAAMPAYLPSAAALTTKLVSVFPENRDRPTHQALICAFDDATGTPLAVMDGTYITEARTAAGSALATWLLARDDGGVVAIVGTGAQAHAHARALSRIGFVTRINICGRRAEAVTALVERLREDVIAAEVEAAPSIEEGVRSADIVCLCTHSDAPVIRRDWLRPGTHVNSVGFNTAGEGEVDAATIRDAALFVESRAAALAPPPTGAIDLGRAIAAGIITPDHVRAEIGELVAGTGERRRSDDEITLYKSVGVAVQDAAAAALVLRTARERGIGTEIEI